MRRGQAAGVVVVAGMLCSCGGSGATATTGTGMVDHAQVSTVTTVPMSTPAMSTTPSRSTVPDPSTSEPFVWDVATDIVAFPADHYEASACTADFNVLEPGDALEFGHLTRPFAPAYPDLARLRGEVSTVFVATVDHLLPGLLATPIRIPDEYKTATGVVTGQELATGWTPTVVRVDSVLWGEVGDVEVLGESGCYAEGTIPSLTPGSTLLVFAEPVDVPFGPYALFGATYRIVDWLAVDDSNHLIARSGAFGWPTSAPFLEGLELSDAVALLSGTP